ncbi:hypothetical protein AMRN_0750 [Malaciobacter marinus]|uniref:Uncharacterized protein n=1 Tax=Malaciobacter marinus TaxID=505249 RepID=A0A347TIS6_9BACT|nr:hypothetical protein [Malaciobacter marinus]AXX86504.1 hypothetical protein AMRN_0750 [Malaciobacter marinus]PHO14083.1 hypothetical protein CPH92_13685 [Malaciobacter marinus]
MYKKNLLICILLLTTNLFSFDKFEELRGSWIVSHYDKNKKISFLNLIGKEININFLDNKKVSSSSGYLKNMGVELKNNTFTFGTMYQEKIKYNKYIYKLNPRKEYLNEMVCYQLKPVKINAGFYNKNDVFKLCREQRKYIDKSY